MRERGPIYQLPLFPPFLPPETSPPINIAFYDFPSHMSNQRQCLLAYEAPPPLAAAPIPIPSRPIPPLGGGRNAFIERMLARLGQTIFQRIMCVRLERERDCPFFPGPFFSSVNISFMHVLGNYPETLIRLR